jgi:hypothetical protein
MQLLRLALTILVLAAGSARADVFAFLDGFEKCLTLDHLVETTKTDTGAQQRVLGPDEIQPRCVDAAVRLLAHTKNKELSAAFVVSTKRLAPWVRVLPIIGVATDAALDACNDIANYEVVMRPLDDPPDRMFFPMAKRIIHRCLEDHEFKRDFLDEKDSKQPGHRAENACQILLEEKLVKTCPGAK